MGPDSPPSGRHGAYHLCETAFDQVAAFARRESGVSVWGSPIEVAGSAHRVDPREGRWSAVPLTAGHDRLVKRLRSTSRSLVVPREKSSASRVGLPTLWAISLLDAGRDRVGGVDSVSRSLAECVPGSSEGNRAHPGRRAPGRSHQQVSASDSDPAAAKGRHMQNSSKSVVGFSGMNRSEASG